MIGNAQTLSATGTATTAEDVGYHVAYDYVNEVLIYTQADGDAGAHVVSTAQLTDTTVRVMAVGY